MYVPTFSVHKYTMYGYGWESAAASCVQMFSSNSFIGQAYIFNAGGI